MLNEDIPGRYLNRHPEGTQTFRHGKVSLRHQPRLEDGVDHAVTVRRVAPKRRTQPQGFPWHLMGR